MNFLTTTDVGFGTSILILPLGSWEQHGPHLPLHTDSLIIDAVVRTSLESLPDLQQQCVVAPTMTITASDEHDGFPGGLSCGNEALQATVVAICRSASWARGICIANGHGGNVSALRDIASALQYENINANIWSLPSYSGGDMHAGYTETSLLLHIAPDMVRLNAVEPGPTHLTSEDFVAMRTNGVRAVSDNGVLGDPRLATHQHGQEVLAMYAQSFRETLMSCATLWPSSI